MAPGGWQQIMHSLRDSHDIVVKRVVLSVQALVKRNVDSATAPG